MSELISQQSFGALLLSCGGVLVLYSLLSLLAGYGTERFWWRRGRKIFELPMRDGQLQHETLGTVLFHILFVPCLAGLLASGWLHYSDDWKAELLSFAFAWYGFQFYYYWLHRLMHLKPFYWAHRWHHLSMVTSPMTGFSMHPMEAVGWTVGMLGPAVLLSSVGWLGFWGYAGFLGFMWFGNIVGHANAEYMPIPSTPASSILISNPISYHSLHHARFLGHYGFGCATMDRLFGTEFPDWLEIHRRIFSGTPLKAFHERGSSQSIAPTTGKASP